MQHTVFNVIMQEVARNYICFIPLNVKLGSSSDEDFMVVSVQCVLWVSPGWSGA